MAASSTSVPLVSIENPVLPTHYEIHIELDPSKTNFKASSTISLKQNASRDVGFQNFKLHCKDLVILSAEIKNDNSNFTKALKVTYDQPNQLVNLSSDVPIEVCSSEILLLKLVYIGKIKTIKTHRDETTGIFKTNFMDQKTGASNNFVFATHCQPSFARTIFPCVDEPSLKATFQLSIKTLEKFEVISNMTQLSSDILENDAQKLVKFKKTPLMITSVFGFVVGDLEYIRSEVSLAHANKTIPLSVYSPWNVADSTFTLDTVQKYLPILETFFQKEYPLDKLDFVLLPFLSDMAMENFGMISVQMNHLLLSPTALADISTMQQVKQLIVHELVHQWMGNYISFNSWEYLWFNEAFATWCASHLLEKNGDLPNYWVSDDYLMQQNENLMISDSHYDTLSISAASKKAVISTPSQTQDLFDPHSYAKGIAIIRSLQLCIGEEAFQSALQKVFQDYSLYERSIKPIDIFVHMGNTLKSENVANYFSSWCQIPGLPIVSVTVETKDSDTITKLVQHRLVKTSESNFEDIPYHIPLFIQLPNGERDKKNILMTDRTATLDYPIVLCNHDAQGYYRVSYESEICYSQINDQLSVGKLSEIDMCKIFVDLSYMIGDMTYQKSIHLSGLCKLLKHLASKEVDLKQYWRGLYKGLEILQTVQLSILTYASSAKGLFDYMDAVIKPLIAKIDWPTGPFEQDFHPYQLKVMSQVLFFAKDCPRISSLCDTYFKCILQGPSHSIPMEIVGTVFAVVSQNSRSVKQWKKLFGLVKSCKGIESHVSNLNADAEGGAIALQNCAIMNLGFSLSAELINKTLNFVSTNVASTGIELALFGMSYNARVKPIGCSSEVLQVRELVWEWFVKHYDGWARNSLKQGPSSSEHLKKSLSSISLVVFQMFVDSPEKIDVYVIMKQSQFGKELGIDEVWKIVKDNEISKMKIYQELLGFKMRE